MREYKKYRLLFRFFTKQVQYAKPPKAFAFEGGDQISRFYAFFTIKPLSSASIIRLSPAAYPPDKMLFGTDTPWHTPDMEKRLLGTLGLSDCDMDKITHKNAQKLLGIE